MPAVQYPFIDIAVHERVKDHFARGEAIVLFSLDLADVLWANGQGASLFGKPVIYDLIEDGPNRTDVTFRQVEATGRQLSAVGESRNFLIRIAHGFQRIPVQAVIERIHLTPDVDALLFAAPVGTRPLDEKTVARDMLQGFDDDDTHMAVLGGGGEIIASSPGFAKLALTPATARTLVGMAGTDPHRLVKRPIPTAKGYLPAAIGKVSDAPALHLLFAVETILGNMGPATPFPEEAEIQPRAPAASAPEPAAAPEQPEAQEPSADEAAASVGEEATVDGSVTLPEEQDRSAEETAGGETDTSLHASQGEGAEAQPGELEVEDVAFVPASPEAEPDGATPTDEPEEAFGTHEAGEIVDAEWESVQEDIVEAEIISEAEFPEPDDAGSTDAAEEAAAAELPLVEPEEPPSVAPEAEEQRETPPAEDGFHFNRAARPTRFVWKIDAEGQFSEVSAELAAAVGPHAAHLAGTAFADMARLLDLDPEGKIAELLSRRDTWSGKTIYWPIEGTSLRAPVDLAALPTYRRNREFDGFRGFGIVRLSDAVEDPLAIGLTLGEADDTPPAPDLDASQPGEVAEHAAPEPDMAEAPADVSEPEAETRSETPMEAPDVPDAESGAAVEDAPANPPASVPPRVEPPVLRISEPPQRAEGEDKVIRLEERRPRGREGLTPGEQEAFREIARQLESLTGDEAEEGAVAGTVGNEEPVEGMSAPAAEPARGEDMPATPDVDANSGTGAEATAHLAEEPAASPAEEPDAEAQPEASSLPAGPASTATETEQLEILAASIPARTAMEGGLSPETLDEIPVALLIHAGERLIHANPEFLKLSGYRRLDELEAVGGLDSLLHHKELEDMPDQSGGLSLVRADDQLVPVTARLQSVRWDDQTALLLALIPSGPRPVNADPQVPGLDDAEEERLNGRIHDLEVEVDELRSILETATDGVVIIGPEGDIRSMNRSASALFDYDEAETRGKPFVMLFAHESHRAVADYLAGMTGHGVASVLNDGREVIGREASGGFIPLFMTIGKLSASNGFCAVIRDITQWKRSEEDLKSAKRAAETANAHKSDFLARVSHEIRTPLNAIIGFSDMMAIEHFGPIGHPRYVEYANDIARSGRLVLDIVNDLLDISKIEAGEMELEFTAVGLNEAVSEAVSLVQPQAHSQRVIIRTAFSDAVPDVVADLRSIKQIVLNILANAIRFTPAGGQIVVSTAYETNGSVVLRIRDTGIGMTRAELEQAMKPFRQVTAGARKRGDGTGLGLPLTKAMVDANRASFAIQSAPNEGTLVEITFPSPRVLAN